MEILISGVTLCVLHLLGMCGGYDEYGQWFAFPVHIVGGIFLLHLTGSVFAVLILATLWEVFEYWFDQNTRLGDVLCWKCRGLDQALYGVVGCLVGALIV